MQDTINELQRELSALGKSAKQTKSRLSSARGSAVSTLSLSLYLSVSLSLSLSLYLCPSLSLSLSLFLSSSLCLYVFLSLFLCLGHSFFRCSVSFSLFLHLLLYFSALFSSFIFVYFLYSIVSSSLLSFFYFFYFPSPFLDTGLLSHFFNSHSEFHLSLKDRLV